jgi:hypothetical protein
MCGRYTFLLTPESSRRPLSSGARQGGAHAATRHAPHSGPTPCPGWRALIRSAIVSAMWPAIWSLIATFGSDRCTVTTHTAAGPWSSVCSCRRVRSTPRALMRREQRQAFEQVPAEVSTCLPAKKSNAALLSTWAKKKYEACLGGPKRGGRACASWRSGRGEHNWHSE